MTSSMVPPHLRDQLGHLASQDGPTAREMYEQARQRDREEQEQQQLSHRRDDDHTPWRWQQRSRRRDYDPAPRQFTTKDIADFEKAEEFQALQGIAQEVRKQDILVQSIENLMNMDTDAYHSSVWPEVYSRVTGADKDAESSK